MIPTNMCQLAATLNLTINQFRALGGIFPVSATMTLGPGTPDNFTLHGKNVKIELPQGQPSSVTLTFALPDPNYVLLGIAFAANTKGSSSLGRTEFPSVAITRNAPGGPTGSTMVVTDSCDPSQNAVRFNYVIMVQSVSTAEIGIIDPDIETEVEN